MRAFVCFLLLFVARCLFAADIAVVYPVVSVPEGESAFAQKLAGHLQRWYKEAGIEVDLVADRALNLRMPYKLVFLVDCYTPPLSFLSQIKARMEGKTKIVVCYSGSAELAKLFGLKPGTYQRNDEGRWSSMKLQANRPKGAPAEILQTSTNIFSMAATQATTVPMAHWVDRAGKSTDVVWWKTAEGHYWMTHILTGDGDEAAKQRFLLAVAAECVPGIWQSAANHLYAQVTKPLNDDSLNSRIRLLPKSSARRQQQERILELVRRQQASAKEGLNGDTVATYQAVCDLRDVIARAYGLTYWARPGEVRGVWDHSGQGLYPGDWERTAKLLADHHITDLYVNIAGAAFALYPSKVLVQKGTEDQLAAAVRACHKYGVRVHAWILCFSCERAAPGAIKTLREKGWMLQDAQGKELTWLDPTHPQVRAHLKQTVAEIATRYDVDGIHLDFIRFPGLPQSLGPRVRARFEQACGRATNWPKCVTEAQGDRRAQFFAWRAARITDAVQDVRQWMKQKKPRMTLSAAVYGKYPACVDSVGQDWISWLRIGLIDHAVPMNYTEDLTVLEDWLGTQTANDRFARKVLCGIGVTATESRLEPIDVLRQIELARKAKCGGFVLFDLDETLRKTVLPVLSEGVSKE